MAPEVSLELEADPGVLVVGSAAQRAYIRDLVKTLAESLGVPESDIEITSVDAARRRVLSSGDTGLRQLQSAVPVTANFHIHNPAAPQLLDELSLQLANPTSAIYTGGRAITVVLGQMLDYEMVCPVGTFRNVVAETCSRCPLGQEPNAAQDGCDACSVDGGSDGSKCVKCLHGHQPTADRSTCAKCERDEYSSHGSICLHCPSNLIPTLDQSGCECPLEMYDNRRNSLYCHEDDPAWGTFIEQPPVPASPFCTSCPDCFDCSVRGGPPLMNENYGLGAEATERYTGPHANGTRIGIRCPHLGACRPEARTAAASPVAGHLVLLRKSLPKWNNVTQVVEGQYVWVESVDQTVAGESQLGLDPFITIPILSCAAVLDLLTAYQAAEVRQPCSFPMPSNAATASPWTSVAGARR